MIEFRLPSLGADMDEGKLIEWKVKPGDRVKRGDLVAVVETPKAAVDVEIWQDGVVHELVTAPGTKIPVGTVMARLLAPGEAAPQSLPCVLVAPAGTPLLYGNRLDGEDYHDETLPYAEAGLVALMYELHGGVSNPETAGDPEIRAGYLQFRAAAAGCRRFDLRRPELAVGEPAGLHGADDGGRRVAAWCARQLAEAVGLNAESHAADGLSGGEAGQCERAERQRSEFTAGHW